MTPCWIDNTSGATLHYEELEAFVYNSETNLPHQLPHNAAWLCLFLKALAHNLPINLQQQPTETFIVQNHKNPLQSNFPDNLIHSSSTINLATSGTTGQPKTVVHSIQSLTREVRTGEKARNNVWALTYLPTHMAGLQVIFQAILNRNTIVDMYGNDTASIVHGLKQYHITHLSGTPTFYRLVCASEEVFPLVQRVSAGGERSDTGLITALNKTFPNARLNNIYASTEGGTLLATTGDVFTIPAQKQHLFKIADNELHIHHSLLGNKNDTTEEWYATGDLVELVPGAQTSFRFTARRNELINSGGYKINPGEVEAALHNIEMVQMARVYGRPNSVLGNVVIADVVPANKENFNEVLVREMLSAILPDYKIPRLFILKEQIEHTSSGKIKRR